MRLAERLALHRPELRAWAMYDWANSAFITIVVAAIFPIYFSGVASKGATGGTASYRLAVATTIALAVIAVASPLLGAIADRMPVKKRMLATFTTVGVIASAALALVGPGDWVLAAVLFGLGNIAANGAFVFYDALLPHVARPHELDRLSTAGYALGYLGGGVLLALTVVTILHPAWFGLADAAQASRLAFLMTAAWWAIFAIPLFRRVREPDIEPARRASGAAAIRAALGDLRHTTRDLRRFPHAALLLVAFLIYNDGIGTIIRMAAAFGTEIGLPQGALITALLIVQFVGIPCSFLFGQLAGRIGPRRAIFLGLAVYCVVSVLGYFMTTVLHFYLLSGLVGLVQGGTQALSRSLFASMIPRAKASEFFGLFAVFEKFAGIFGPALFAVALSITGSSRPAILSIMIFFVVGALLLARVDVAAGQGTAAEVNRDDDARRAAEAAAAAS